MNTKKLLIVFFIIMIISCREDETTGNLIKEDMFTLPIGNMDGELDFFAREGIPFSLKSDIHMSKGQFLVSNGNGKKIMKFNSYGNLLKKISPEKITDLHNESLSWDFNEPGVLSATENYIYIEDTIKYDTSISDNYIDKSRDLTDDKREDEKHILTERIIHQFNSDGKYINFIGQDGIGGSPFPFINNIYNDSANRLIVITQTTYFWSIYRYTESGDFIDQTDIELDYLPSLENEENIITQINNIIPDKEKERVLIDLTFYKKIVEERSDDIISMNFLKSRVYYYNLNEKKYISWMDIPESSEENSYRQFILQDIVQGKYLFFTSFGDDGISEYLTITNENGYRIGDYNLNIDNTNIIYHSYYVSYPEGILTALLCTDYAGGITWWRTDKILQEDN